MTNMNGPQSVCRDGATTEGGAKKVTPKSGELKWPVGACLGVTTGLERGGGPGAGGEHVVEGHEHVPVDDLAAARAGSHLFFCPRILRLKGQHNIESGESLSVLTGFMRSGIWFKTAIVTVFVEGGFRDY